MSYSEAIKDGFKPQFNTGTATSTVTNINKISCLPGARAMKLFNRSESKAILYSLDGGVSFSQVPALDMVDEYIEATEIQIKSASSTAVYDLKVALRQ